MILGVLVRDVDSGNAEREPIDDPTGWKVISAAGARPSGKPLIPVKGYKSTSSSRTTSTHSRSNSNPQAGMSFMSNAHLEFLEEVAGKEMTSLSNRFMFEDSQGVFEGEETLLVDGKLSTEPQLLTVDSSGNSRVSKPSASSPRSQSYPLESSRLYQQQKPLPPPPQNKYVTQAPSPIQPPSIFRSSHSSQSLPQRIYKQGSSSGSTPNSSTTSFSFNTTVNYGGKMTEVEKKRYELQMRVYRARTQIPSHIVLRVFREPSECVEVEEEILRRESGI